MIGDNEKKSSKEIPKDISRLVKYSTMKHISWHPIKSELS